MELSRRGFLGGLLARPALVRSGVLMRVSPLVARPLFYNTPAFERIVAETIRNQVKWIEQTIMYGISTTVIGSDGLLNIALSVDTSGVVLPSMETIEAEIQADLLKAFSQ